ncbi:MAG: hypothetical protein ACJZ7A_03840 [Opitutales bacterium]
MEGQNYEANGPQIGEKKKSERQRGKDKPTGSFRPVPPFPSDLSENSSLVRNGPSE